MKITNELEAEINTMMDDYWGSYFRGDLEHWQSYLVDDYRNIGGTEEEIWNSKQEIVEYTHRVIDQMAGLTELRNVQRQIIPYDGYLMVHEFMDIFIRIEEKWTFYGKFRLSSLIQKIADTWKVLHQHGSYPDSHTEQGEAFAFDTLRKENTQLREAVKRRTVELENKNHELKIEVALERVRSASMAMQGSEELATVARTVFEQLRALGIDVYRSWIDIFHMEEGYVLTWSTDFEGNFQSIPATFPLEFDETMSDFYRDFKSSSKFIELEAHGDEVKQWFDYLYSVSSDPIFKIPDIPNDLYQVWAKHQYGTVATTKLSPITENEKVILNRFAKVFEQAYTRFLDLQKAEAQAREAQIEAALERVRSRTMAMQKGEELQEVAVLLYKELIALGVTNFVTCGYVEVNEEIQRQHTWVTAPGGDTMGLFHLPLTGDATFDERYAAWKNQETVFHQSIAGQVRNDHLEYAITTFNSKEAEEMVRSQFPDPTVFYCFNFPHGYLHTVGGSLLDKDEEELLARFTKVFAQTYTRFLDLQKAEEQAREANIEMSLEKIRSRTMGMQKSEELPEAANLMFLEIQNLGINAWSCGYCILEEDRRSSMCITSSEGTIQKPFLLPHIGEESFEEWDDFVHSEEIFFIQELKGDAIQSHYDFMLSLPQLKPIYQELKGAGLSLPTYQINHLCKFSHGFLLFITHEPVPEAHDIFKRFTAVFNQTYTRFLDLEKSEQRAREAEVELALERIRSQVTAMQKSSDLFDIVVNMRKEFISLGHKADYFWHMNWMPDSYEMSMTSEDGNRIGMVIRIPKFVHDSIPGLADWEKGTDPVYVMPLNADDAWSYIENMNTHGRYEQADPNAPEEKDIQEIGGLTFILARTSHGEIGYSLPGEVPDPPEDALDTLKRFAGVFDLAYQRFEDLQEAEQQARLVLEERDRLEAALNELHATQDQLVQQEKLASLGQLTAGIAHEIKNPLNFVNNFSDVSIELVEEARDEVKRQKHALSNVEGAKVKKEAKKTPLSRGDGDPSLDGSARGVLEKASAGGQTQDPEIESSSTNTPLNPLSRGEAGSIPQMDLILEILDDIEANLRKIHEHGSRADSIVKSMLQHSRGGDGKPEPTDLNALVKEYVNLAFHGMRAGAEPIDVEIEMDLDDSIGEVPLVAEDFSRVILNLCNNGFDALREGQKNPLLRGEGDGGAGARGVSDEAVDRDLPQYSETNPGSSNTPLNPLSRGDGNANPKLTIRTRKSDNSVSIAIEDNGPGIPEEIKDKILQPFFTTKKGTAGTGLGLSITNDIIKAHGGRLEIESVPREKTIFIIHLEKRGQDG
ncbi:ATP-binding protein [Rhodohalobacter mucosus]|uniref:histidine kinase n=1 Tax=Rhodohalobacter mucosus TaxID=2079485 RepID=A0A316TTZ9_9BACT|nr:ATP-binding protein [Rhodohalobacter mucosus]PWN05774.1 hypothetical protein DDZ15_11285 [Rhodohalobacter mucosus]